MAEPFIWGVSTASYQIEGATKEGGRSPSIWDKYCLWPGKIANGDTGDIACDHYHRYAEDIGHMRDLGVQAYRFSIAWPRVIPSGRGAANPEGIDFYNRLIDGLLAAGIEPWLCLYHWDLPQVLDDQGGWQNRDIASWFAEYATLIGKTFGDRVKRFATFNEPSVFSLFGYAFSWQAPGLKDRDAHHRAIHNVNRAHGAAVDALRASVKAPSIGIINNFQSCLPEYDLPENREAAALLDLHWNHTFADPQILGHYPERLAKDLAPLILPGDMESIKRPIDWLGINHYSPIFAKVDAEMPHGYNWGSPPSNATVSQIGWPIFPDDFRDTLLNATRTYKLPIYVTENGAGGKESVDANGEVDDQHRVNYLKAYIAALDEAKARGADVRGYFVWSLLDNFEWGAGYENRFGLYFVDYPTQRRIAKASAKWYKAFIAGRSGAAKSASAKTQP